jgi:hypothetical protein
MGMHKSIAEKQVKSVNQPILEFIKNPGVPERFKQKTDARFKLFID